MILNQYSHHQRVAALAWTLFVLWSSYSTHAAPIPEASVVSFAADNSTNSSTIDPFTTPSYLAPSTFTWEQGVYGALFLFFGAVEVLHGYKYIRFTMLVTGFLFWSSLAVMIMLIVDISTNAYQSSGLYFIIWLLVGIVGAIASFYLWHVGIILTGTYGAVVVVAVIFTAANVSSYAFRYSALAVVAIAGGYLTKRYERMAVILATSLGGAYCMMFGLDMFVQTGFRATFHVMLSQSSAAFDPVPGTWVMIAFVPVIAAFGVYWELKHHEQPVGSWWLGIGAKPLPPLPGEKPPRRCCGLLLALPFSKARKLPAAGESDTTLVPPAETTPSRISRLLPCLGKRDKSTKKPADAATASSSTNPDNSELSPMMEVNSDSAAVEKPAAVEKLATSPASGAGSSNIPIPFELEHFGVGHETIGHTGVHKVVINHEVREFSLDVDEKL
ncbi:hypothetical protein BGX21_005899 [Mortierella sp. AD011]|nr:hypothetical protein BGX20_011341 [Mortierella sp. AD010]KAF9399622.1 hypothetical protein BGX21_005899 [Mortierella sp. AD011]